MIPKALFAAVCLSLCLTSCLAIGEKNGTSKGVTKKQRAFSLFSVVQFKNGACTTTSTNGQSNRNGTCFTEDECSSKGGMVSGNCAAGFGVCCLFLVSSTSTTINQNCTYVRNPGFPSALTTTTSMDFRVEKCATDVCLLRLDFESFTTVGPTDSLETGGGTCPDTFTVTTSSGMIVPEICGANAGQHMYVKVDGTSSTIATLAFAFSTATTTVSRSWEIKVTQLSCQDKRYTPPDGCLQYHTGLTGRFTTFNFESTTTSHLRNQAYNICMRREAGMCCIQYSRCSDTNSYTLDTVVAPVGLGEGCQRDYITIPAAAATCSQGSGVTADLQTNFCSLVFSTVRGTANIAQSLTSICSCSCPFTLSVRTDATADFGTANTGTLSRGLCLNYNQIPCQ